MSITTKYPRTITQTNGSRDRKFSNLNNLKKSNGYCVSESIIAGRNGTHNKPSILTVKSGRATSGTSIIKTLPFNVSVTNNKANTKFKNVKMKRL